MMTNRLNIYFRISALCGLLAVALGAFGAHGLKDFLTERGMLAVWQTAVLYQLVHAPVLLFVAWAGLSRKAWWCFACGVFLFSGSLYMLTISGVKFFGYITPFGGVALLVGWLLLIFTGKSGMAQQQ
jgi:uncharacterized membrane protein YgdD (TMEM256/DUF423 family)